MANSSTPSSSITTLPKKHEVFLSFRGEDTRYGFTSHLYDALCRKQIETFIDDDKLERGDEISPALLRAIEGSKIAVVIFSKNYASSKWCLRELAEIIKCKKMNKHIVMPVFYHVDPSDVRKLTGSFKCSFANEEKVLQEEVQKWREALTEASNLSGWDSSVIRTESKLVGDIVEGVWRKLRNEYISTSSDFEGLIGIYKRIEQVMSLLCLDMEHVRIIGIWGMGGIGKTTIAQAVFKFISYKFDGACFIEKVWKRLENGGSDQLQLEIYSEVLHEENPKLYTSIRPFIMEKFNQKKVFIVLDDVNNFLQSESLVESLCRCGLGSRIIITSRDKQILCNFNIDDHEIYEAEGFNFDEALELFHKYANPNEDCMALSKKIVNYAKGNPLAIKVLGSSLKGKSKSEWEDALVNLHGIVNSKIFDVLKFSYDGLEEEEKKLFLDLACFKDFYYYHSLLKEEFIDCREYSLSVLVAKSLATLESEDLEMNWEIEMHDLLQEMGREIVRRESPKNPGKRSRLWKRADVIRTLKNNTGTDAVEAISLDVGNLEDIHLSSQVFDKMHNLRIILFNTTYLSNKVYLPNGLNCLPDELMILHWPGYPLKALPSNFNPEKLVKLDLSRSNIEQLWEGTKHAPKLKWLILRGCPCLARIPNLSYFPLLVEVDIRNCKSLVDFPSSVQQLNNLWNLTLKGCINIERLNLLWTAIEEVPSSIQSLTNLTELDLTECKRLKHISASICKLKSLSTLYLKNCSQLETFPEILETMEFLKSLDLSGSAIKVLPSSVEHLNGLRKLTLSNCKNIEMLPSSICNLTSLEDLDLSECSKLEKLPVNLGNLKSLKRLEVWGTAVGQLPSSITCLENLKILNCSRCSGLTRLPPLSGLHSLPTLNLRDCSQLEIFPEILETMEFLKYLELSGSAIKVLPPSVEHLNELQCLTLSNCKNLEILPSSICNLTSLEDLNLCNCSKLNKLPDNLGNLNSLKRLNVSGTAVRQLPSSMICLENLEILDCSGCWYLTILPPLAGLRSLRTLYSKNCSLMEITEDIGCLSSLERLDLSGNMFESLPKSIKQLSKLKFLSLSHCQILRSIPELPEGLECLEAMDCDQLCQVPDASEFVRCINSKSHYHLRAHFTFTNSLN
ncbi:hypothetical protein Ddye_027687 [Dipteronia dyeriana]|uniref:TIR domain-containing protein n=1 Tax=Dipteronia dyeriana TaxID=168575 RepID=A0AAD9TPM2_9ROSI|nr:hypothetical protein Ddye_027687 [Dipteronia dyeriana]